MKVIRAGILGFCSGVRRAVDLALNESSTAEHPVYTLGPLIHNSRVLSDLKGRGIVMLEEGEFPPPGANTIVIIRAHGVPLAMERELRRLGCKVIDATCPHVKASQKKAAFFSGKGYTIFLAGEENHAEIISLHSYAAEDKCFVVADPEEAEAAALKSLGVKAALPKTALIGQTTISPGEYKAIGERLRSYLPDLEVVNTICGATMERQEALKELMPQVDAVVIAGCRDSANARRLLSIALDTGKKAWLVESANGILPEAFTFSVIGLSAGASTPDETICEIEQALLASHGEHQEHSGQTLRSKEKQ